MDVRMEILKSHTGSDHHEGGQAMLLVKGDIKFT